MDNQPETTAAHLDEISILLIGNEEEQNEAVRLIDKHLRRPIVAKIRRSAIGLPSADLPDVYQEVLLDVLEAARKGQYDPDRSLLPFIFTVAYRRAIDRVRKISGKQVAEAELLDAITESLADTKVGEAWREVIAREEGRKMMEVIRNTIAKMPARQRQVASVVIERFPDTATLQEIRQEILGRTGEQLTVVAVKRARQEARKKIREQLVLGGYMERSGNGAPE